MDRLDKIRHLVLQGGRDCSGRTADIVDDIRKVALGDAIKVDSQGASLARTTRAKREGKGERVLGGSGLWNSLDRAASRKGGQENPAGLHVWLVGDDHAAVGCCW